METTQPASIPLCKAPCDPAQVYVCLSTLASRGSLIQDVQPVRAGHLHPQRQLCQCGLCPFSGVGLPMRIMPGLSQATAGRLWHHCLELLLLALPACRQTLSAGGVACWWRVMSPDKHGLGAGRGLGGACVVGVKGAFVEQWQAKQRASEYWCLLLCGVS